jgi:2-oxoglutarate dehydrogenase E1 component
MSDLNPPAEGETRRLVLCSGKLAYELMEARDAAGDLGVEIVRIEQLYPFPSEPLVKRLKAMPKLQNVIWAQEEPKNNGAWLFVQHLLEQCLTEAGFNGMRPQYAGRDSSASPATGLAKRHAGEQAALIAAALGHDSDTTKASERPGAVAAE